MLGSKCYMETSHLRGFCSLDSKMGKEKLMPQVTVKFRVSSPTSFEFP